MAEPAKKKPDLAVVIGVGKPKKPSHSEPAEEEMEGEDKGGEDMAHEDAMGQFKAALDSGDNAAAVDAFKVLYDLCKHGGDGEKDEEY